MGNFVAQETIALKGPILHWLDRLSVGAGARGHLEKLDAAIKKLAPTYNGLEGALDECLAAPLHIDAALRKKLLDHLAKTWFNDGRGAYFPGQHVTPKYAQAVIKTLELSLKGKHNPVPINAWWLIQTDPVVSMLTLADVDHSGVTVGSSVTLLINTPRPPTSATPSNRALWGDATAFVTEHHGGAVRTRQIEKESKPK
jgi:hypothetical protein